jgi:steroid delta-isomerase
MLNIKGFYRSRVRILTAFMLLIAFMMIASPMSSPRAAARPMVNMTPEQIEAAVEEYFTAICSLDVQRYVNTFALDGVLEDPVGTPPLQGQAVISAYITSSIAAFSSMSFKIQDINVCGHEAAVNWKVQLKTTAGKKLTIDGMGVFNFNPDGKLQSVREFWDLEDFLAQMQN